MLFPSPRLKLQFLRLMIHHFLLFLFNSLFVSFHFVGSFDVFLRLSDCFTWVPSIELTDPFASSFNRLEFMEGCPLESFCSTSLGNNLQWEQIAKEILHSGGKYRLSTTKQKCEGASLKLILIGVVLSHRICVSKNQFAKKMGLRAIVVTSSALQQCWYKIVLMAKWLL